MNETIGPQAGPQSRFLSSPADIVIYGGAAGGGKTFGLLLEPLRHIYNAQFGAVIFRRTFPQIVHEGGLWDESELIYPHLGATANRGIVTWKFPSGAKVAFSHMQYEGDRFAWDGSQIPLIGWDQLEHFTELQFFYMLTRNRSTCGVRPYVRATCNPDPDSWLADFVSWWINPETGYPIEERSGVIRWFVRRAEKMVWGDSREALLQVFEGEEGVEPKSATFIASSIYDNQILLRADPGYLANLKAQGLIEQERLLKGNWKIRASAGKVFNRGWFRIVDAAPAEGEVVRFWDFAATERERKGNDPDWTAGVKMRKHNGIYYIEDVAHAQENPIEVDRLVFNTAVQDGHKVRVGWEVEGGSSGKKVDQQLAQLLAGFDCIGIRPDGDKLQRSKPLAAQALAGNVCLVRGPWNEAFLKELHGFPDLPHDDQVDGGSGAFNLLTMETAHATGKAKVAKSPFGS